MLEDLRSPPIWQPENSVTTNYLSQTKTAKNHKISVYLCIRTAIIPKFKMCSLPNEGRNQVGKS